MSGYSACIGDRVKICSLYELFKELTAFPYSVDAYLFSYKPESLQIGISTVLHSMWYILSPDLDQESYSKNISHWKKMEMEKLFLLNYPATLKNGCYFSCLEGG